MVEIITGYIFGCIQGAYIISKTIGKFDIRDRGSGNSGASNITNVMGWKYGAIVALIDILKAVLPMLFFKLVFQVSFTELFIVGFSVVIGHIFPLPLKFKGGKGIASFVGMCLVLDLRLGFLMAIIIILITVIFNYIFIASITVYVLLPIILIITHQSKLSIILSLILMIIGIIKHYSNVISLRSGKEVGLRAVLKKNKK